MPDDDRPDFDLFTLLQGPATVMSGVRGLADNGRKAVTGLLDTIASLQRAAVALEALASRVDRLVTDIETPMRLLTPELEKAANRVLRVAEILEGPIDRLLPGLEQAVDTFDRVTLNQLPDNLDALRGQVATVVDMFAELPRRLGTLGGFGAVAQLFPGLERLSHAAARLATPPRVPQAVDSEAKRPNEKSATQKTTIKAGPQKSAGKLRQAQAKTVTTKSTVGTPSAKKASMNEKASTNEKASMSPKAPRATKSVVKRTR